MDDDPLKIPKAIKISRKCLGIVKAEHRLCADRSRPSAWSLGALGLANMWVAIIADVGVMIGPC